MFFNSVFLIVILGVFVLMPVAIVGEVFLALRPDRRWGLLLPGIFLGLAAVLTLGVSPYYVGTAFSLLLFLASCIPVLILMVVYAICRHVVRQRQADELKKMEIQDL